MGGLEDQMVIALDMPCVAFCMPSPKDECPRRSGQLSKHLGGKRVPTQMQMPAGISLRNRERGVEEQYARIRPTGEIARCGRTPDVVVKLTKDVSERLWQGRASGYRKRQPVGMAERRIRILAEYDHTRGCRLAPFKGSKTHRCRWQDPPCVGRKGLGNSGPILLEERQFRPGAEVSGQIPARGPVVAGRGSGP